MTIMGTWDLLQQFTESLQSRKYVHGIEGLHVVTIVWIVYNRIGVIC